MTEGKSFGLREAGYGLRVKKTFHFSIGCFVKKLKLSPSGDIKEMECLRKVYDLIFDLVLKSFLL